MTYKINGAELTAQPAEGRWMPQQTLGTDGYGRPLYPAFREFEIRWEYISAAEVNQIVGFIEGQATTGTVVADLPEHGATPYGFYGYTGCVLQEPEYGPYFQGTYSTVTLVIAKVLT